MEHPFSHLSNIHARWKNMSMAKKIRDVFYVFTGDMMRTFYKPFEGRAGLTDILIFPVVCDLIVSGIIRAMTGDKEGGDNMVPLVVGLFGALLTSPIWILSSAIRISVSAILTAIVAPICIAVEKITRGTEKSSGIVQLNTEADDCNPKRDDDSALFEPQKYRGLDIQGANRKEVGKEPTPPAAAHSIFSKSIPNSDQSHREQPREDSAPTL